MEEKIELSYDEADDIICFIRNHEREEIPMRGHQHYRGRGAQDGYAQMVEPEGELSEDYLLGVLRSAVVEDIAYRGQEAGGGASAVARIERVQVGRQRAAAGKPRDAQMGGVHLRPRRKIVAGADAVPDAELRGIPPQ